MLELILPAAHDGKQLLKVVFNDGNWSSERSGLELYKVAGIWLMWALTQKWPPGSPALHPLQQPALTAQLKESFGDNGYERQEL